MQEKKRPIVNPSVVLREEFDDWAILFDPDSNLTLGINPMGVHIWKCLDGTRTIREILLELRSNYDDVPDDAEAQIEDFIQDLVQRGLARYVAE